MKTFIGYALTFIVGLLLLSAESIKPFLAFLFMCILMLHYRVDFNRKMIRVAWVGLDTKLLTLIRNFKIDDEEIKKVIREEKRKWGEGNLKSFKKDMGSVMGKKIIDDDNDL
jgi:hypothetical protein